MSTTNWKPCAWRIEGDDPYRAAKIEIAPRPGKPDRFAVRRMGSVLNKDGEWEFEPQPSSRDEAFFARCRFDTFEAADAAYAIREDRVAGG
jgi:hypothetical protein